MTLLNASNISHKFDYPLFNNVNLTLEEGESIAIIGASGSGKSTLLHILSTLLEPDKGKVTLFDENIFKLSKKKLVKMRRDDIGLIFQSHYLFKGFSALENLEVAAILAKEKISKELLKRLDIIHVLQQKVTELSGGQQQRISIARVLTKKPKIIFADEPTGNLDHTTANDVMNIFEEYLHKNGAAMILVTHDEELAARSKRVYRLQDLELIQVK